MNDANVAPVFEAAKALRAEGLDARTTASLFLNVGAVLVSNSMDEETFLQFARETWRRGQRQVQLVELVDRACGVAGTKTTLGDRTPRRRKAKATS